MSEKIDINVADAETLAVISGIGPVLAERIIEYRQTVHSFEEVIELAAVPGISEKMVRKFENLVTVSPVLADTAVPTRTTEPEEPLLLDAPEAHELLSAPPQPEGLLAAEVAAPAEADDEPTEVEEIALDEGEAVAEADMLEDVESTVEIPETAVSPAAATPNIEETPLVNTPHHVAPEPEPIYPAPPAQATQWEANAQRRGCISTLLGATFGAILGAVLTLAILAALNNGSLTFAATDAAIRQQLNTEIISRTNELNQLSTRVSIAATEEAASNQVLQDEFSTANQMLSEDIAGNEENISYLATRSGDLEIRLQEVAGAADTFTGFLDGLRGLLNDLEEGTATPTPAPIDETVTPTPTSVGGSAATAEPEATAVSPTNTPTGVPTRTPLPTATPFTFPTNTPAPQP